MKTEFAELSVSRTKTFREKEQDKDKGKRRYRERVQEDREAIEEIKQYDLQEHIDIDDRETNKPFS